MSEKQVSKSTQLTEVKEFQPTPAMRVWLDTAIKTESDSITDIEKASKITAQSWYNWLKLPGFIEWYDAEWTRMLSGFGWKLDVIGMKNAKKDHRYWESMQKRMGRLQDKPTVGIVAQGDDMSISFE